jgi:hypothetical protein
MAELDRPPIATLPVRTACWVTKATDTHSEYVTHFFYGCAVAQLVEALC